MADKRHQNESMPSKSNLGGTVSNSFVLEKGIFSSIFEKDIRRVYIYKKCERLAKAIHLITPAFRTSPALRDRLDRVSVGLVDAGSLPPATAKSELSRELLALSSVLAIARAGGLLSEMNADFISREAHTLLQEIAIYEEPRLLLEEAPSLAELSRESMANRILTVRRTEAPAAAPAKPAAIPVQAPTFKGQDTKGQSFIKDKPSKTSRREAILDVLRSRGSLSIRDIAISFRDVSEKTIQRELQALINENVVTKSGDRRWTVYSLA